MVGEELGWRGLVLVQEDGLVRAAGQAALVRLHPARGVLLLDQVAWRGDRVTLYCSTCSVSTFRFIQTILVERTTIEAALDPAVAHAGRLVQDRHLHRVARPGVGYCSQFPHYFNPLKIISVRPLLGSVVGEHGAGAAGGDDGHAGYARVEGVVVRGLAGEAAHQHHPPHPVLHLANHSGA